MNRPAFHPDACGWRRWFRVSSLALVAASLNADPLTGGSFVLVGAPAAGGTARGGDYVLRGYVAASGANISSGEAFDLTCGLIGVYTPPAGMVELRAELTSGGQVRIWWPADATGYRLEFTPALGPAPVWQAVEPAPSVNEYVTGTAQPARFYRLRQP